MFVCTGNICRSPMAELVMKQLVRKEGLDWVISSAANTGDEVGNPVYPPVRALLEAAVSPARGNTPCSSAARITRTTTISSAWTHAIGRDMLAHLRRRPRK